MNNEQEHTCQFCYYEYFDGRAYPCSMCVCGEERKDMFQPKGRQNKRKEGEWVDRRGNIMATPSHSAYCTNCGVWSEYLTNYCGNCGAEMRKESE